MQNPLRRRSRAAQTTTILRRIGNRVGSGPSAMFPNFVPRRLSSINVKFDFGKDRQSGPGIDIDRKLQGHERRGRSVVGGRRGRAQSSVWALGGGGRRWVRAVGGCRSRVVSGNVLAVHRPVLVDLEGSKPQHPPGVVGDPWASVIFRGDQVKNHPACARQGEFACDRP